MTEIFSTLFPLLIGLALLKGVVAILPGLIATKAAQKGWQRINSRHKAKREKPFNVRNSEEINYSCKPSLLTDSERDFLAALDTAIDGRHRIFAQVRFADIVAIDDDLSYSQHTRALNRVAQKSIDFLVCQLDNLSPLTAIEVDDRSHLQADRRRRDDFVNEVCERIGLPLVRFPAAFSYDAMEIRATLAPFLRDGSRRRGDNGDGREPTP